jgi:hypothetical protein
MEALAVGGERGEPIGGREEGYDWGREKHGAWEKGG